jgi:hypothetical protein
MEIYKGNQRGERSRFVLKSSRNNPNASHGETNGEIKA